jgi:uncharacterized protein YejL (UPF0352 family)
VKPSAKGEKLYKSLRIRIIGPGMDRTKIHKAAAQRGYTENDIDEALAELAGVLEKAYPGWDFRLVELGPASYNFIYAGPRKQDGIESAEVVAPNGAPAAGASGRTTPPSGS